MVFSLKSLCPVDQERQQTGPFGNFFIQLILFLKSIGSLYIPKDRI